jgi:two-component system, chemotaxis family, sensor kinase CheA
MDSLINEFLQECTENLNRLDHDFVCLEKDPKNAELLGSIFRAIHTIKGTCGFLGFGKLEMLTHAGENLLAMLRAGEIELSPGIADGLLEMADAVRVILKNIEETGTEGTAEYPELIEKLKQLQQQRKGAAPEVEKKVPTAAGLSEAAAKTEKTKAKEPKIEERRSEEKEPAENKSHATVQGSVSPGPQESIETPLEAPPKPSTSKRKKHEVIAGRIGGALVSRGRVRAEDVFLALEMQEGGDRRRLGEILVALGKMTERDIEEALAAKPVIEKQEGSIRVDVHLLEKQMNLVSELVLLRNRLLQIAANSNERNLNASVHGLNYITSELRKNVMKTRMQPVSQLFDKLPRIVRDVSKDLGKKVKLETNGGETELDKTLLEAIKDPVTHILRNSLDHGIESPEDRKERGKPEEGTVRVRAFHEGGNFHLEIEDDGAGINAERVKQKALGKGLINPAQAEKMTRREILNLVFQPGLSTAEKVTNVSGRGVGMDVVKTNIERIGGTAKIESTESKGTTVWLEIPLTLATIPALTVVSGESIFAIPQAALVEMIAIDEAESSKYIECIDKVEVFRFRGTVLPLICLREELKLSRIRAEGATIVKVVVVCTEGRQIALRVDDIRNTEEIVIKPLDKRFKSIALYSGAAVLGDGRVALILDVPALARRAGVVANQKLQNEVAVEGQRKEKLTLLLLGGPDGERMAMPLDCVQRLEEFEAGAVERMGEQDVVQYRGDILRLVHLQDLLEERRAVPRTEKGRQAAGNGEKVCAVVVRASNAERIILEVHQILGIVKVEFDRLTPPTREGVRGSLVVQERVTELLNLETLLAKVRKLTNTPEALVEAGLGD